MDSASNVSYFSDVGIIEQLIAAGTPLPSFEPAGPRSRIFHDPGATRAGIVTCGGLCPGINDVIKAIVQTLFFAYGVERVEGFRYGYRGLIPAHQHDPVSLDPDVVDSIHENGGSILGSSRGQQDIETMVDTLQNRGVNILFTIGGDGTQQGALAIAKTARARALPLSVVGVPKTVDNDLGFTERTFGFETAVYAAGAVIGSAHDEAKGALNGVSLVRLFGRDSGFIAASATLANSVVNFCLIPEVPFELDGPRGFLPALERRLGEKQHAVVVVAEGAGQDHFRDLPDRFDASGNLLHDDIGLFLRDRICEYLARRGIDHVLRYFDPSYLIRSVPARGTDAVYCLHLAENAVHAAMAGRTGMVAGSWHDRFVHVPIELATRARRKVDPGSQLWRSVVGVTRQEQYWPPTA